MGTSERVKTCVVDILACHLVSLLNALPITHLEQVVSPVADLARAIFVASSCGSFFFGLAASTRSNGGQRSSNRRSDGRHLCNRPHSHTMASSTPVVLVTGASRGIGLSTVQYLLQSGLRSASIPKSNVVTLSRSMPSALSELQRHNSDSLECVQGDLLDESVHEKVVQKALDKWGRLDAVILNAGVIEFGRVADAKVRQRKGALYDYPCNLMLISGHPHSHPQSTCKSQQTSHPSSQHYTTQFHLSDHHPQD